GTVGLWDIERRGGRFCLIDAARGDCRDRAIFAGLDRRNDFLRADFGGAQNSPADYLHVGCLWCVVKARSEWCYATPLRPSVIAASTKSLDSVPIERRIVPPVMPSAARPASVIRRWLVDSGWLSAVHNSPSDGQNGI